MNAYATPLDQRRRDLLWGALRTCTVPLRSARPSFAVASDFESGQPAAWALVYVIDMGQLDAVQRCRLVGAVAARMGQCADRLYDEYRRFGGVPLDARGVLVSLPAGDWCSL